MASQQNNLHMYSWRRSAIKNRYSRLTTPHTHTHTHTHTELTYLFALPSNTISESTDLALNFAGLAGGDEQRASAVPLVSASPGREKQKT